MAFSLVSPRTVFCVHFCQDCGSSYDLMATQNTWQRGLHGVQGPTPSCLGCSRSSERSHMCAHPVLSNKGPLSFQKVISAKNQEDEKAQLKQSKCDFHTT